MARVPSPRSVFVDHPVGRTFGRPGASEQHERILADALDTLGDFKQTGEMIDLPHQWEPGGTRLWEAALTKDFLG